MLADVSFLASHSADAAIGCQCLECKATAPSCGDRLLMNNTCFLNMNFFFYSTLAYRIPFVHICIVMEQLTNLVLNMFT